MFRVALAALIFAGYALLAFIIAESIANPALSVLFALANGLIVTCIVASLTEWVIHQCVCHSLAFGAIYAWHRRHHEESFPSRESRGNDSPTEGIYSSACGVLTKNALQFGLYVGLGVITLWIPSALASASMGFLLGVVSGTLIVSCVFVLAHHRIHNASGYVFYGRWFRRIAEYHGLHHHEDGVNFNLIIPLADWLFGTYRVEPEKKRHNYFGLINPTI